MSTAAILALLTQAQAFITQIVPNLIALANAAKAGASETDIAKLDAAIAAIQPANDALHGRVQGL